MQELLARAVLWEEKEELPCSVAGCGYSLMLQECPAEAMGSELGDLRAGQWLPHLRSLGLEQRDAGGTPDRVTGLPLHLPRSAGTVFGTEGLSRVKLLIKQMLGLWL